MGGIAHHTAVGMTLVCSKAALGCWANRSHLTAQCEKEPQRKGPGETGEEMLRQASQAFFFSSSTINRTKEMAQLGAETLLGEVAARQQTVGFC